MGLLHAKEVIQDYQTKPFKTKFIKKRDKTPN